MSSWSRLAKELDSWVEADDTATFWWRDDDAVDSTPQLDVLLRHAGAVPLALAVIPDLATPNLAKRLRSHDSVVVVQHGWRHANHATAGNSEYPAGRPWDEVSRELAEGRAIMASLFGPQSIPVFAPPWHGFDESFLPLLRPTGLVAISRKGPRPAVFASEALLQVNVHMSPIRWSVPPSFGDMDLYLEAIIDHLRGRRVGIYDRAEPTGLLTHHLVQNEPSYEFISEFVQLVSAHPAAAWRDAREIFGVRARGGGQRTAFAEDQRLPSS